MKVIAYDGVKTTTDDGIAEAVLRLALTVALFGRYEMVTFPVVIDGGEEQLTLMLGPTIHISMLSDRTAREHALQGVDRVVAEIEARIAGFMDPAHLDLDASPPSTGHSQPDFE